MISDIAGNFEAENSLSLAVTAVFGQHIHGNNTLLHSDNIKCCPLKNFGGKQFHCYMSCDLEVTSVCCWEKISSHILKNVQNKQNPSLLIVGNNIVHNGSGHQSYN